VAARDGQIDELRAEAGRILDALPDPILMVARDGHVARTNRTGRELFGNDVVGRDLAAVTRDPALLDAVYAARDKGEASNIEVGVMAARVARTYGANVAPLPVRGNGGPAVMAVLHDLTAIKRTEQMRVDFVANASHEIRSPLATLVGCIETMRGPARDDQEAWDGFLEMMDDQGRRMTRLVGDLLSLSRIELNEHTQPTGEVKLATVLAHTQTALEWEATAKDMVIRLKLDDNLPTVRGETGEIEQVAYNLLSNAIKYGRAGTEITVTGGMRQAPPERARMDRAPVVWFAVRDRGEGIAEEHLPRLTERFYRVDTARSRELGGTGLGLAIVKHVLNRHRGDMTIDSAAGEGSIFSVYLPAVAKPDGAGDEAG
jgi:two-component system phosphate regulon sensor histidine kinase PhoR